ncbi:hypothetical protein ACVFZR_03100 [Lacticaseibacillus paracasei]
MTSGFKHCLNLTPMISGAVIAGLLSGAGYLRAALGGRSDYRRTIIIGTS